MSEMGVIVGCDRTLECLLPWWWEHYSTHNPFAVAFADFGMSPEALAWCQQKGPCLTIAKPSPHKREQIPLPQQILWEKLYGNGIWQLRDAWFLKPQALIHSPFSIGLWIDLDCQILGSLEPLFNALMGGMDIGLVKEPQEVQRGLAQLNVLNDQESYYNSGVILFRQHAPILYHWAQEVLENHTLHTGDQGALCRALFHHPTPLIELPALFNWLTRLGPNPQARILHFSGQEKLKIFKMLAPQN